MSGKCITLKTICYSDALNYLCIIKEKYMSYIPKRTV